MSEDFDRIIGHTVTAVEHNEYGDTALFRLDDGSVLRVVGHSYEDVDLSAEFLTREAQRREAAKAQGAREQGRLRRLQTDARLAAQTPEEVEQQRQYSKAMLDCMQRQWADMAKDINRQAYGTMKGASAEAKTP